MASVNLIPPAGTPNINDPRNPTLIPNFDRNLVGTATGPMPASVSHSSPAAYLASNPRVNATATATIGGSVTTGDEITIEIVNGSFPGGLLSHTYTTVGGDTVTTIAEQLADLFNADPIAAQFDIECTLAGAVITFNQSGPIGNFTTLVSPTEAPATITIAGTALTGDTLEALFNGPVINPIAPATAIAILAGTFALSDTVALTFTNAGVAGLPITKTYTVLAADIAAANPAASVATGLTALINGDATLGAADIVASVNGAQITVSQEGAIGNSTVITRAVSGSETVTFLPANGHMGGGTGQPGGVLVSSV